MLTSYFDDFATRYAPYKGGDWCYEDGCIYRGLLLLDAADPSGPWFGHLQRLIEPQISPEGALFGYDVEEFNIDNILSGRALIPLFERTGDTRYWRAAETLAGQLRRHPRIASGNYWHKRRYPHQVWLDGLYMGLPFQIEFGRKTGDAALVDDAVAQLVAALRLLRDPATGLYRHGYDDARQQYWADPQTGLSAALWTRAIGWMAMALVDIVELIGLERARAEGLIDAASDLARKLIAHQRDDGRFYQVTDQPGLKGNYPESSATAMLAYVFLTGARLGIPGLSAAGEKALEGLMANALREEGGRLTLSGICHVAGLGGYEGNERDGSAAYYVRETIVSDDSKGVGPLMMAVAEDLQRKNAGVSPAKTASGQPRSISV